MLMNIYCGQWDLAWEDKPANFTRLRQLLARRSPPEAGGLLVLPEMFATGFSMNVDAIAEDHPAPTEQYLGDLAREYNIGILGGLARRGSGGQGRNEAVLVSPDGNPVMHYAKRCLFTPGGEDEHYESGEEIVVADFNDVILAPFICYDLRFAEPFRAAARAGAEILVVIANWPAPRLAHWQCLLRARAIENQAFVVGINRCGRDPSHSYPGNSLIINPQGTILLNAGNQEGIFEAILDTREVQAWRNEFPAWDEDHNPCQPVRRFAKNTFFEA